MTFLVQQTLIYAVPLMIVALAGVFAERSGIINLALEGIMIFGAFIGVLFVRLMQGSAAVLAAQQTGNWVAMQGLELLAMLVTAAMGAVFSLLLSFASINLRADQTIGGTALNLMAPALVLFLVRIIANQNTLQLATGDSATWFMIRKSTFGIDKNTDLGFFGETFLVKVYLATYVCIILFVILSIILYKTRFGLRLRACGENPQAADSLGINVYKMRYIGTTISGALAGMGGFVYALTTANCSSNGDVAGFGFLALAVMIFGNWRPLNIAGASLLFGLFKCIAAAYSSIDINGDGVYWLAEIGISSHLYRMLPYIITLLVLASFFAGVYFDMGYIHIADMIAGNADEEGVMMAFITLNMVEIFHCFNMRSRRASLFTMKKQNKWLWASAALALVLTVIVTVQPTLAEMFFGPVTLELKGVLAALGLAFLIIPLMEIYKAIMRAVEKE